MPVKISDALPARSILERENIFVMTEKRAISQDIRPLRLVILNLMPLKTSTETSLLRRLSNTPLQIEVDFLRTATYTSRHASAEYLEEFYKTFDEIKNSSYDGMIITGAPVETMDFEDVEYWDELCEIMDWAANHVFANLFLCWGAQAGLYYHHGIQKYPMERKMFGVFEHKVLVPNTPLLRGFDDIFFAPHSRHTEVRGADVSQVEELEVLSASDEAGLYIVVSKDDRQVFVFGHPEYESHTLDQEYRRDLERGLPIDIPKNYYHGDDPERGPSVSWYSHAQLLYTNWLNYYVYQTTPFDLNLLPERHQKMPSPAAPRRITSE
ncbi:MAG TPA: homoserine O-succinyltransferase [Sphaerochaetaceae bacterium]|jgi:homoserine O-succinyltransferase|nr:homoserine O-succinyltransferase [Sphaerochaetaceae bacterium]